jgi:hypothetical protein
MIDNDNHCGGNANGQPSKPLLQSSSCTHPWQWSTCVGKTSLQQSVTAARQVKVMQWAQQKHGAKGIPTSKVLLACLDSTCSLSFSFVAVHMNVCLQMLH